MKKVRFIKIDLDLAFSSFCDTEAEVMEGCGFEADEMDFEEFCRQVEDSYEIIRIEGDFEMSYLNNI
jgi:enolase